MRNLLSLQYFLAIVIQISSLVDKIISSKCLVATNCLILFSINPPSIPAKGRVFLLRTRSLPLRVGRKKAILFPMVTEIDKWILL